MLTLSNAFFWVKLITENYRSNKQQSKRVGLYISSHTHHSHRSTQTDYPHLNVWALCFLTDECLQGSHDTMQNKKAWLITLNVKASTESSEWVGITTFSPISSAVHNLLYTCCACMVNNNDNVHNRRWGSQLDGEWGSLVSSWWLLAPCQAMVGNHNVEYCELACAVTQ